MFFPFATEIEGEKRAYVTYGISIICIIVYYFTTVFGKEAFENIILNWGFTPAFPGVISSITALFLHGSKWHLIGNIYFLILYGRAVESSMNRYVYLAYYILCGFLGNWLHLITVPQYAIDAPCIGASGAISGIMGAYMLLYPKSKVYYWYFIIITMGIAAIPAWFVIGGWFMAQLYNGIQAIQTGYMNVGFFAHVGGFVFGGIGILFFKYRDNFTEAFNFMRTSDKFGNLIKTFKNTEMEYALLKSFIEENKDCGDALIRYSRALFLLNKRPEAEENLLKALEEFDKNDDRYGFINTMLISVKFAALNNFKFSDFVFALKICKEWNCNALAFIIALRGFKISKDRAEFKSENMIYNVGEIAFDYFKDSDTAEKIMKYIINNYPKTKIGESARFKLNELGGRL